MSSETREAKSPNAISREAASREAIVKEIAKTSESIRQKYHALKTGKMEEDVELERHFKPITEPLKQLVENTVGVESNIEPLSIVKNETFLPKKEIFKKRQSSKMDSLVTSTPKKKKLRNESFELLQTSSATPKRKKLKNESSELPQTSSVEPRRLLFEQPLEEVYESSTLEPSFTTVVRNQLQTPEGLRLLQQHLGPLGQKYITAAFKGKDNDIAYGVKFTNENEMKLGDKKFEIEENDTIIIDGIRYAGTSGLYELIFKKEPKEGAYTEADLLKYKSILLNTNAHKRDVNNVDSPIKGNRGKKYKNIIAPLVGAPLVGNKILGKGLPLTMMLTDNKIDYVHWNDPNELVDRLRLLESSHQAGNNAHDNEILSIIEELREAGIIIN